MQFLLKAFLGSSCSLAWVYSTSVLVQFLRWNHPGWNHLEVPLTVSMLFHSERVCLLSFADWPCLDLEGVDFNIDSRCKSILDLLKWASTQKYKIGLQNANPLKLKSGIPFWVLWDPSWQPSLRHMVGTFAERRQVTGLQHDNLCLHGGNNGPRGEINRFHDDGCPVPPLAGCGDCRRWRSCAAAVE